MATFPCWSNNAWANCDKRIDTTPDSAILGCTHYPLVADLFAATLSCGVPIIHQPEAAACALKFYLNRHPEYDTGNAGRRMFLSTPGFPPKPCR